MDEPALCRRVLKFAQPTSENDIWAEYGGGSVVRGYLVGTRTGADLHFRYSHLGVDGQTSGGVCDSAIEVLDDGRVRFHESWTWTS